MTEVDGWRTLSSNQHIQITAQTQKTPGYKNLGQNSVYWLPPII